MYVVMLFYINYYLCKDYLSNKDKLIYANIQIMLEQLLIVEVY